MQLKSKILCCLTIMSFNHLVLAQSSSCSWAQSYYLGKNTAMDGFDRNSANNSMSLDNSENLINVAYFNGRLDLDPSNNTTTLNSDSGSYFIQKLSKTGDIIWTKQFGLSKNTGYPPSSLKVTTDRSKNIYVACLLDFNMQSNFDCNPNIIGIQNHIANNDVSNQNYLKCLHLLKLDSNAKLIWVKSFSYCLRNSLSYHHIAVDNENNLIVMGDFWKEADFDFKKNNQSIKTIEYQNKFQQNDFYSGVFVCKIDKSGNFLWANHFESPERIYSNALEISEDFNIYLGGSYRNMLIPMKSNLGGIKANNDVCSNLFLAQIDSSGKLKWQSTWNFRPTTVQSESWCYISGLKYVNKQLFYTAYFDNGIFEYNGIERSSGYTHDIQLGLIDPNGALKKFETYYGGYTNKIAFKNNSFFITGSTYMTIASRTLQKNIITVPTYNSNYTYILKVDSNLNYEKSFILNNVKNNKSTIPFNLAIGANNEIYLQGSFSGDTVHLNFDSIRISRLIKTRKYPTDQTQRDVFLLKYHPFPIEISSENVACYSKSTGKAEVKIPSNLKDNQYVWNIGKNSKSISNLNAGVYNVEITDDLGCKNDKKITILENADLKFELNATPSVCSGPCDGFATISVSGGVKSYLDSFNGYASTSKKSKWNIKNICPGKYKFTINDSLGCKKSDYLEITAKSSTPNSNIFLTNIAAIDKNNVPLAISSFYNYNLPNTINPPASNPRNFADPGKLVRFKVECTNKKENGLSIVSGICKVRSNSNYINVTDSSSALNNIGWNDKAWSADEFEININPNTQSGSNAYIDFVVQENGIDYKTPCIAIPIRPLVYSPTIESTIDDDDNPDSKGNNNNLCESNETIEFYPHLDNVSNLDAQYVRGKFENLNKHSYIQIWNQKQGVNTTVYDETWWNYAFAKPQVIPSGNKSLTPEYDFVFDVKNSTSIPSKFDLHLVLAGGFKLFSGDALSLVQWSLPFTFDSESGSTTNINELAETEMLIFPNPSKQNITFQKFNNKKHSFHLYNVLGNEVFKGELIEQTSTFDISHLSTGVYYIVVDNQSIEKTTKLIKN